MGSYSFPSPFLLRIERGERSVSIQPSISKFYVEGSQPPYMQTFSPKPGPGYLVLQQAAASVTVEELYRHRASERSVEVPDSDLLGFT